MDNEKNTDERSPWTRPGFVAAAAFLVVLVLLAGIVVVITGGDESDSAGAPAPSGSAGGTAPGPGGGKGANNKDACPTLKDTAQDVPQSTPKGLDWSLVQTVALPTSKASGPAVVEGSIARCFAHTPTGALIASAQIGGRYVWSSGWKQVTQDQTVGDGKSLYIKERTKVEASQGPLTPQADRHGQLAGFTFITYTPQTAVIQLVHRFANGGLVVTPVTMRWERGDWRLVLPANHAAQTRVNDLSGFVAFGGV
ncbi:hypothetical protein SAMN05428942_7245 [Streptomyces sp. 2112.2]|uniref:hypothetical protein n=1 Tax=Streptomyces sp. 2112.2 TaxID=1881024 RepID=UPI000896133F|nr:hypothetical protein [Streptomyces sp. 2112.2]SEF16337.1 hypothetical protein SAMN05428942_7245 [Streptomyces sp. 2112.2]